MLRPYRVGTGEATRFDSIRIGRSDSIRKSRADSKIFESTRACPLLVVVKRLKPLTALSGTVYRLASSMSDHTPVNVFEDSNEESVVPHISFDSIRDSIRTQTADSQVPSI